MAPSPCIMMNPVQGSPSQDAKQLHQKEETDTEGEEAQPKDMTTEKGYKLQRSSLPFSVESLISKKTTCRTSYPPSDLALVLPQPAAGQGSAQFSPRTLYAERKVSAESSQGVSSSSCEDSPQCCEKDQSTWFQTSSFSTPPSKSVPLLFWTLKHTAFIHDLLSIEEEYQVLLGYLCARLYCISCVMGILVLRVSLQTVRKCISGI